MAQLIQVQHLQQQAVPVSAGFATAIRRQRLRLVSNLSGGRTFYRSFATPVLPASMTEPVSFDDSADEDDLSEVQVTPVDESEDDW